MKNFQTCQKMQFWNNIIVEPMSRQIRGVSLK